jgi:hypothetical protein
MDARVRFNLLVLVDYSSLIQTNSRFHTTDAQVIAGETASNVESLVLLRVGRVSVVTRRASSTGRAGRRR